MSLIHLLRGPTTTARFQCEPAAFCHLRLGYLRLSNDRPRGTPNALLRAADFIVHPRAGGSYLGNKLDNNQGKRKLLPRYLIERRRMLNLNISQYSAPTNHPRS